MPDASHILSHLVVLLLLLLSIGSRISADALVVARYADKLYNLFGSSLIQTVEKRDELRARLPHRR